MVPGAIFRHIEDHVKSGAEPHRLLFEGDNPRLEWGGGCAGEVDFFRTESHGDGECALFELVGEPSANGEVPVATLDAFAGGVPGSVKKLFEFRFVQDFGAIALENGVEIVLVDDEQAELFEEAGRGVVVDVAIEQSPDGFVVEGVEAGHVPA